MRLASWVLVPWLWLTLSVAGSTAFADDDEEKSSYRIVVDRVELEPAAVGGQRLRLFVSAISLQGQRLDLTDPKAIKVYAGSSELKAPYALGTYASVGGDTALVIVVQATVEFTDVLPVIAEALDQHVLAALPDQHTQVAVLPYGESIGSTRLGSIKQARDKLSLLQSDGTASEPTLLDSLEHALHVLRKATTKPEGRPIRKMIVVVGDGRDLSGDRERVTRLGVRAAKEGVRIHTFAYSPNDVRRPLLVLGELAKRSFGTFRWIRNGTAAFWTPPAKQLGEEITGQYVVTAFPPSDTDLTGRKVKVVTTGRVAAAALNDLKIPEATCAGEPCEQGYCTGERCVVPKPAGGRGVLGWILLVVGIVVGALVILGLIGYVITKRQQAAIAPPPGAPGFPPPAQASPKSKPPKHAPASAPPVAVAAPVVAGPRLYILSGPRTGETIALRHGFTIGKQPGCDLVIDDGYASSFHAQISMDHFGNCRLYDQGSTNGTFINGVRVTESGLEHGGTVRIGSVDLRFLAQ